jgi:hypothetical protein
MQKFSHFDPDLADVFYKACDLKVALLTALKSCDTISEDLNTDSFYLDYSDFYLALNQVEIIKGLLSKIQAQRDNPEYWSEPSE